MLIFLIAPNDSAMFGQLFNGDGIRVEELLQGALALLLAPTTGDDTYPFAALPDIRNLSGKENLVRSYKLPAASDWVVT